MVIGARSSPSFRALRTSGQADQHRRSHSEHGTNQQAPILATKSLPSSVPPYTIRLPGQVSRRNISMETASTILSSHLGPSISQVLHGGSVKLSFENLYRIGYSLSLDGYSELIYQDVSLRAKEWAAHLMIKAAPQYRWTLASIGRMNTALIDQRAGMVRDVLTYLDRTWIIQQHMCGVHDVVCRAFLELVVALVSMPTIVHHLLRREQQEVNKMNEKQEEEEYDDVLLGIEPLLEGLTPASYTSDHGLGLTLAMLHTTIISNVYRQVTDIQKSQRLLKQVRQRVKASLREEALATYRECAERLKLEDLVRQAVKVCRKGVVMVKEARRRTRVAVVQQQHQQKQEEQQQWSHYCNIVLDMLLPEPSPFHGSTFEDFAQNALLKDQLLGHDRGQWLQQAYLHCLESSLSKGPVSPQEHSPLGKVFGILPNTIRPFLSAVDNNAVAASCRALSYLHLSSEQQPSSALMDSSAAEVEEEEDKERSRREEGEGEEEGGSMCVAVCHPRSGIWRGMPYIRIHEPSMRYKRMLLLQQQQQQQQKSGAARDDNTLLLQLTQYEEGQKGAIAFVAALSAMGDDDGGDDKQTERPPITVLDEEMLIDAHQAQKERHGISHQVSAF